MSESGRRFEGPRFEAFESHHTPEVLRNTPEQYKENPICEAEATFEVVQRRTQTLPRIVETRLSCDACPFKPASFMTSEQGHGRDKAIKEAQRILKSDCGKWNEKVTTGEAEGKMPDNLLPNILK